ncbi:MAG: peptide chain release factor N(5)-glutamine methyltransferase [Luteimonas sp.]
MPLDAVLRRAALRIGAEEGAVLFAHASGKPRAWAYAHGDWVVEAATLAEFDALVARRAAGEPVAYLTGLRGFWTLELTVSPDTLIPRADTERLVELALARMPPDAPMRVADLGTGSGAIALALASERPRAHVTATDASAAALAIAQANALRLDIGNVEFRQGSWWQPLDGMRLDMVVGNPPYIADDDAHLHEGDLRFEPVAALASGPDGLNAIRRIVADAPRHLIESGWLLLEHGCEQGAVVRALFQDAGLADVETARDLEDRDRVTLGRKA